MHLIMTVLAFLILQIPAFGAPPHWETKSYQSPGKDHNGYYGFYMDPNAQAQCRHDESLVSDALYLAARDVQMRCQVTDKNIGGVTYQKIWVLEGTFRVLVE